MSRQHAHAHAQAPLFRYERHPEEDLGRRLIASSDIRKDRLIFVERPVVAMQSMGNMHEGALVCSYCMAFCGSPEQTLRVMSDPSCLKDIATNNTATTTATAGTTTTTCTPCRNDSDGNNTSTVVIDDPHALYCCRHNCGHVYCSLECQQDDWEWGGHKELCTGLIPDPDEPDSDQSNNNNENGGDPSEEDTAVDVVAVVEKSKLDPLLEFKIHAGNTNEIFFLVATWLVRILKHDLPYHEDDNLNSHPYTDFQMNPWWDVKAKEEEGLAAMKQQQTDSGERKENNDNNDDDNNNNNNNDATTESLADVLKQLCEESCSHLSKALVERQPRFRDSPWLTPVGMARLIGSLEQNCLGIRRKHALQRNLMLDADLRQTFHDELIRCLEGAGMIGGIDDDEEDEDGACDDDCSCDEDDGDAKAVTDGDTDTSSTDATNTNVAHNADANADANANANTDTDLGTEEGVDTEAETSTSNKHSPDAVASFLAGLTQDLTDGCVLDEWDEVIRPLDGVSHYSIATKMNHSCEPNVVLVYKTRGWGRDHPLVAYVVALRDIAEGDELTISYVDSDDPYEERQAALANYGFVCACRKCQREKTGETAMGGGDNGAEVDTNSFPEDDDDDDLFGGDDDDEDDEADLFGDDDDEDDDTEGETNTHTATNHNKPDGNDEHNGDSGDTREEEEEEEDAEAESLLELAERLDAVRNESRHGAIPLEYLAPASNYVLKLIASLLDDIANIDATNDFDFDFELKESLLRRIRIAVRDRVFSDCRAAGSDLESRLYRRLESIGSWPTPMHRASYWCAAIAASIGVCHEGSFLAAMKYLDKATMLGQDRGAIGGYFGYVELHASQMAAGPCPIAVGCKVSDYRCPSLQRKVVTSGGGLSGPIRFPVEEVTAIANGNGNGNESITHRSHILACCRESKACVVRGFASEWEAVETWRNLDELAREFGHRLVPIEIGSMTNTSGMKEAVVTFRRFVADYLSASATKDCWSLEDATRTTDADNHNHDHNHNNNHNKHHPRIAYLAQHPLLDQIPALSESLETNPCGVNPTNINVWMGTGGTRTPLHFDSYDNLLVQIVGAKYVRLYEKEHTPRLYVRTGAKSTSTSTSTSYGAQGNMSELDCEQEDYEQHPLARDCEYREVLLFPGDCLFIPSRQWHYVRSLSTSVSVNYWF